MTSNLRLFQPLAQGTGFLEDVTKSIWPTYRRQSLALGGDFRAGAMLTGSDQELERWFDLYLGAHFVEQFGGVDAFQGYVHNMLLSYNGLVLLYSLQEMFNSVAVWYQPGEGEPAELTSFSSDSASIALWGTRQLIYRPSRQMSLTAAESLRDKLLSEHAVPRIESLEVDDWDDTQQGSLKVDILGYIHTLDWQHLNVSSKATDDADDEVSDALSGADFVTAGTIDVNTLQIAEVVEYRPAWQRISKDIIPEGDSSGNRWLAGCYASRALDYQQANVDTITYYFDAKSHRPELRRVMYDVDGNDVPDALVQPGRVAFARDVLPGRARSATLLDDPRAIFIESIEYSAAGIKLHGASQQEMRLAGLEMSAMRFAFARQQVAAELTSINSQKATLSTVRSFIP